MPGPTGSRSRRCTFDRSDMEACQQAIDGANAYPIYVREAKASLLTSYGLRSTRPAPSCQLLSSGGDAPNRVPDVVGNQEGAGLVDRQPDRSTARVLV